MIISPYHGSKELIRNNVSSRIISSIVSSKLEDGRSHISSIKIKDLLDSDLTNSKTNSWRMTIHFEYFLPCI